MPEFERKHFLHLAAAVEAADNMTIDHIGHICFPQNIILITIGRIAFPLFAYILWRIG
jgi:hypothetical protein